MIFIYYNYDAYGIKVLIKVLYQAIGVKLLHHPIFPVLKSLFLKNINNSLFYYHKNFIMNKIWTFQTFISWKINSPADEYF